MRKAELPPCPPRCSPPALTPGERGNITRHTFTVRNTSRSGKCLTHACFWPLRLKETHQPDGLAGKGGNNNNNKNTQKKKKKSLKENTTPARPGFREPGTGCRGTETRVDEGQELNAPSPADPRS